MSAQPPLPLNVPYPLQECKALLVVLINLWFPLIGARLIKPLFSGEGVGTLRGGVGTNWPWKPTSLALPGLRWRWMQYLGKLGTKTYVLSRSWDRAIIKSCRK